MKHIFLFIIAASVMINCSSAPKEADLKLMSFNIRNSHSNSDDGDNSWLYRKYATVKMIASLQPDIIGMQEVTGLQRAFLTDSLPGYAQYGLDRDSGLPDGDGESMSIFYRTDRFELVDEGTIWLSETPDTVSIGWDAACIRTATFVQLIDKKNDGKILFFLNTHFDHVGAIARREEGKMLMKWIDERFTQGATMVLTGDFNSTVENEALQPLNENMNYARSTAAQTDNSGTYHAWGEIPEQKRQVIDHIYVKGIVPMTYRVVNENYGVPYISDHYPILITADYKN
ncbi:MAG: endonuclease/exonuclease/phosphatase family protein [Alistipes sp.]|nr:endonuclease/exonuclease/phosphatase family protein [Candidatus Minthomonas equi]